MCGIGGWLDFTSCATSSTVLRAMTNTLIHRGPDGEGFYEKGPVHLGHRRLSIIDLAGGGQPISNENETIWCVFNGEIFNFRELRQDLEAFGHVFRTKSDTETIVHAYEQYGLEFVDHLRGQFAIAIWDENVSQLVLVRDRMGQKPLYYCEINGGVVFASELKALCKHPLVSREIDVCSLDAYLAYRYIPEPFSIYKGVMKLPAAHVATIAAATGVRIRRYWSADFNGDSGIKEPEALDQLEALLQESVSLRMIADVPLGAFLSGGIDSSLVVACMCRAAGGSVKTFNIGFQEQTHDERQYADFVARKFGTEHHEFVVRPDATTVLHDLVDAFDEPFGDSSALAMYYLAKMTRQHVTVALNGDGGDESFVGYRRYRNVDRFSRYQRLPKAIRNTAALALNALNSLFGGRVNRLERIAKWSGLRHASLGQVYQSSVVIPPDRRQKIIAVDLHALLEASERCSVMADRVDECGYEPAINRILCADQSVYLPGDLLVKADRMTMWHSLEARSPFLDHKIVEFAAGLSCSTKYPRGRLKHLLKKLLLRDFPHEFVNRQKMGFGVPLAGWFRTELKSEVETVMHDSCLVCDGYLDQAGVRSLCQEHVNGRRNHASLLWAIMNAEFWYRKHIAGPSSGSSS